VLVIRDLVAGYGRGSRILDNIGFKLARGEVVALMGRNGMGKTSLMKAITGHLPVMTGSIGFAGRELVGRAPHEIAKLGIGYVPQGREIFAEFTVEENLMLGAIGKNHLPNRVPDWAFELFPVLRARRWQRAGFMSGGEQQQLAIVRALIGEPTLLLLDEPSEGLAPSIVHDISRALRRAVADKQLTVLLVEQSLEVVLALASRALFIENGQVGAEVLVERLRADRSLIYKYLSV
jgi:ABC-type branched-subunit amino acid transport system ATPase component